MRFAVKFLIALWRGYWPEDDNVTVTLTIAPAELGTCERLATADERKQYGLSA